MTDDVIKIINATLTRLLAMREHSATELMEKLKARDLPTELCTKQLHQFQQANIQSDARFAESFVRVKAQKGQGEVKIRAALKQHQIDEVYIKQAFKEANIDWFALAEKVLTKRFGRTACHDVKSRQQRQRFLHYRGFSMEQIQHALEFAQNH